MDLNQIENCINAILSGNDEERNESTQILSKQAQDTSFSYLLAQTIANDQIPLNHRLLCLIIFIRLNVKFPPDLFPFFLPLFNTSDKRFSNQLAILLSKNITSEEQVALILESAGDASLSYINGVLSLLTEFLFDRSMLPGQIILFCANVISETQTVSIDESDTRLLLSVRGLAAKAIDFIAKRDKDPSFVQFLTSLFSLPVNEERNIPIISNILTRTYRYLPETEFFNICFQQLQTISEMTPLSGQLINLAARFCHYLFIISTYESESLEFDISILVACAIQCSVLNSEVIERWKSNINEFLIEEIIPEEYDDVEINIDSDDDEDSEIDDSKYDFVFLRETCLKIADKFYNEAIDICTQMMRTSPYHMEAAFFFLSSIVSSNYAVEIDLACPDDEDPILYGQYIYTLASLNYKVAAGTIEECIESDDDYLILFIAKAICTSEDETFINYAVPVAMKLLNMTYMYDYPECSAFLEIIFRLIAKDKLSFAPLVEDIVEILFKIIQIVIPIKLAAITVFKIFSAFSKIPECSLFIQESTFPLISELSSSGNIYHILCSFDLMSMLYAPLEKSILPYESIEPIFEIFMKTIIELLSNQDDDPVDYVSMDSIMTLIAFFSRSFSPSPFATPICQLLSNVLENLGQIKDCKSFIHLPSCIVHSFLNASEHEAKVQLLKTLCNKMMTEYEKGKDKLVVFDFLLNVALSLSALIITDTDDFIKCIDESEIDIKIILSIIASILEGSSEKKYVDDLIMIAALFKFGDLNVVDYEQEKPLKIVGIRIFCAVFNHLFNDDDDDENITLCGFGPIVNKYKEELNTFFSPDDPFFINHPFRSIEFIKYMSEVLPPLEEIPPSYQKNIQEILSIVTD